MKSMTKADIERIATMLDEGMTPGEIADELSVDEMDGLSALAEDDSDEAIAARYCISADDRYDYRGRELLPRLNEAGEPNWW